MKTAIPEIEREDDTAMKRKRDTSAVTSRLISSPIRRMFPVFLLPMVAAFAIGFVWPFIQGIYLSFCQFRTTSDAKFIEDLGADSLDTVELVMALEDEFDLEIMDSESEKFVTVADVVAFIESKKG